MDSKHKEEILEIKGMTCTSCARRIEKKLKFIKGAVHIQVSFSEGIAKCTYDQKALSINEIIKVIESMGYSAHLQQDSSNKKKESIKALGIAIIILALYSVMKYFGFTNLFYTFQEAEVTMEYGMLVVLGLVTSVHCVAMCGGINLSQCLVYKENKCENEKANWITAITPSLLYNTGRVISYTLVGGIVGSVGAVVSFSGTTKGLVQIVTSVCMIIMGLNMLNVFPGLRRLNPRMPKSLARLIPIGNGNSSPLYVGLLNGLMPCGPLQAMQLYALSAGGPIEGAFAMFLFSIGTVPLMLGIGILSTVLSHKFTKKIMSVGAVLVIMLGISMLSSGLSLAGISTPNINVNQKSSKAKIEDGIQVVETTLMPGQYSSITVKQGIPVKWTIIAEKGSINGCNNRIIIPEYNMEKKFQLGENVIEFTPTETGTFTYSCWMGMIRSDIIVTQ